MIEEAKDLDGRSGFCGVDPPMLEPGGICWWEAEGMDGSIEAGWARRGPGSAMRMTMSLEGILWISSMVWWSVRWIPRPYGKRKCQC